MLKSSRFCAVISLQLNSSAVFTKQPDICGFIGSDVCLRTRLMLSHQLTIVTNSHCTLASFCDFNSFLNYIKLSCVIPLLTLFSVGSAGVRAHSADSQREKISQAALIQTLDSFTAETISQFCSKHRNGFTGLTTQSYIRHMRCKEYLSSHHNTFKIHTI